MNRGCGPGDRAPTHPERARYSPLFRTGGAGLHHKTSARLREAGVIECSRIWVAFLARYNLPELRRCMALSFSAGELSKFAERYRVLLDRDQGVEVGVRTLVKALEGRNEIDALVAALREHKPLVEWPAPFDGSGPKGPALFDGSGEVEPVYDPMAVLPLEPAADRRLADPFEGEEPATADRARSWAPWAAIFAGGLLLGGVVVWLVASRGQPASDTPSTAELGHLAAMHLSEAVTGVATACGGPVEGSSARSVLVEAFRRCTQPEIRPGLDLSPPLPPPAPPPPEPDRPLGAAPLPKGPPNAGCLDACHRNHGECAKSECGREPSSSADYDKYQRCLGGCLQKFSRCRLRCP